MAYHMLMWATHRTLGWFIRLMLVITRNKWWTALAVVDILGLSYVL